MHLLYTIPNRSIVAFRATARRGGGDVSRRKVDDSRRSRIAEENREKEQARRRERRKENNAPVGKRKTERNLTRRDGRTAGKEKCGCCLAHSLAGASIDAFARAFMNELPYSGGSSPLSARAAALRVGHRSYACTCAT